MAFYLSLFVKFGRRTYQCDFGLSTPVVHSFALVKNAFTSVQQPQVRVRVSSFGCMNDMPRREKREIRGSGPARATA